MTAEQVDGLLSRPALVFGSLPPEGRDLDLLLDAEEVTRVRAALEAEGWVSRGRTVALFADCTAFAVDLVDLATWTPSPEVAQSLREHARPLAGYAHLHVPADHHRLLVLARRYRDGMRLDAARRTRVRAFTEGDWRAARAEAAQWDVAGALEALGRAVEADVDGTTLPGPRSVRAAVRRVVPRGPQVVAFSGLDGSGKSTQAEHLKTALEALGYDVSIQWTKVARDQWLKSLVAPVRGFINFLLRRRPTTTPASDPHVDEDGETRNYPDGTPPPPDAAKLLRQSSPLLTEVWAAVLAIANGTTHRREVRRKATRVVICDRYVADTQAHLRYRYGSERSFRLQGSLVHLLSPRPAAAFFLDVSPRTARARKPEQFTTRDLQRLRGLYLDAVQRFGVTVVDVEQPMDEVAARLARETWLSLR